MKKIKELVDIDIITDGEILEELRNMYLENIELYEKKLDKVYEIISKHPYNRRSFELSNYILEFEEKAKYEYKKLIKKGILLNHKDGIYKAKEIYEKAYELAMKTCFDKDLVSEKYLSTNSIISPIKDLYNEDNFIIKDRILSDIRDWSKQSSERTYMQELYFAALNYLSLAKTTIGIDNIALIDVRYGYFSLEEEIDKVKEKIYMNIYYLFKDYYGNYVNRSRKLSLEDKIKYEKEETLINDIPLLKEEYDKYVSICKGNFKGDTTPLEKYMDEEEVKKYVK